MIRPNRFRAFYVLVVCVFALSACVTQSHVHPIDRIVVFGDSNVDTGNLAKLFGGTVPRGNMWQGRNSNGPVVTEYLAEQLDARLVSYAVSGATSGETNIVSLLAPQLTSLANTGTLQQIADFKTDGETIGARDVVIIWAGSNDIFRADRSNKNELKQRIESAVVNLGSAIDQVTELGANTIVIGLRTPRPQLDSEDDLNGQDLNRAITRSIQTRQANNNSGLVIFDAYSVVRELVQNPAVYGLKNVTDLCVENQACLSEQYEDGLNIASTYLNWDAAHKTTRVHFLMASQLNKLLTENN